ncbi:hypothetical protein LMTR13_00615 [Bradyrhizobium icense]|uniref:Uncharacterized protein n=1 Tax=Bradyrhizobium icense TaxID=1274631 RepID=A0A1B1U800_9BRAD|nr:hypothetical protein LMTR13_00615 [Bradyrhizobium icense]
MGRHGGETRVQVVGNFKRRGFRETEVKNNAAIAAKTRYAALRLALGRNRASAAIVTENPRRPRGAMPGISRSRETPDR